MVTSLRVDTEVGQLYVEGQGSGPVVLLWPSLYCTSSMWCGQMPALATHYRVLTLDPPGHGRSGWPPPRFSLADTALATHRVLDAFEVPTAVIIGSAWGGMVAVQLAASTPERIRGIAMINSPLDRWRGYQRTQMKTLTALLGVAGPKPVEPLITGAMLSRHFRDEHPDQTRTFAAQLRGFDRRALYRAVRSVMLDRPSLLPLLPQLKVPVLAIAGGDDELWPVSQARQETATIPDLQFEVVPGTAHLSAYEDPITINRLLIDFLMRVTAPA